MSQILEMIAEALVDGAVSTVKTNVQKAVDEGIPAKEILNDGLLAGMDEVSVLFKDGEMFVPEVLVSANAGWRRNYQTFVACGGCRTVGKNSNGDG